MSKNTVVDAAIRRALPVLNDGMVLDAMSSHLTTGEMKVIADIFAAAGHSETYHAMMHAMIRGDHEVRAVAYEIESVDGPVYALIYRDGCGEEFYTRILEGSIEEACERLDLVFDEDDEDGCPVLKHKHPVDLY